MITLIIKVHLDSHWKLHFQTLKKVQNLRKTTLSEVWLRAWFCVDCNSSTSDTSVNIQL